EALEIPDLRDQMTTVRRADTVLYDEFSRPEFGPVAALYRAHGPVTTEVRERDVTVRGLFRMGTSFGVDGTLFTSDQNFLRMNPQLSPAHVTIGAVQLEPGANPAAVQAALRANLPQDVKILTKAEMIDQEVAYWATATPIGFVFAFGVVMGLVVGMI